MFRNLETYEKVNNKHSWILRTFAWGVGCKNVFMVSGFFSSENRCYGYQIQRNNQFMPILFNFIVFSNTQIFLNMELYVHNSNWKKKLGGHNACLEDIMQHIAKMGVFCSFSKGRLERVLQKLV